MTTTLKRLSVTDVNELREISIETFTDTFGAQTHLKIYVIIWLMHIKNRCL